MKIPYGIVIGTNLKFILSQQSQQWSVWVLKVNFWVGKAHSWGYTWGFLKFPEFIEFRICRISGVKLFISPCVELKELSFHKIINWFFELFKKNRTSRLSIHKSIQILLIDCTFDCFDRVGVSVQVDDFSVGNILSQDNTVKVQIFQSTGINGFGLDMNIYKRPHQISLHCLVIQYFLEFLGVFDYLSWRIVAIYPYLLSATH